MDDQVLARAKSFHESFSIAIVISQGVVPYREFLFANQILKGILRDELVVPTTRLLRPRLAGSDKGAWGQVWKVERPKASPWASLEAQLPVSTPFSAADSK
jgi:hypothetical protein